MLRSSQGYFVEKYIIAEINQKRWVTTFANYENKFSGSCSMQLISFYLTKMSSLDYCYCNKGCLTRGGASQASRTHHTGTRLKLAVQASVQHQDCKCFQPDRQVHARPSRSLDHCMHVQNRKHILRSEVS